MYKQNEFEELITEKNDKITVSIGDPAIRLIKLLEKKGIEDEELGQMFDELLIAMREFEYKDKKTRKAMMYKNAEITTYVRKKYELVQKGALQGESMAIFIAIGVAIGAGFSAINPAFIGIGLPIGLAIGLALGGEKEKKAEAEDRVY